MIDLTGFSQGFTQRTDENRRSRQEFAKAFEEFKRNNPYASLEEFQSFIDQSTGGNNYLSAGAPSGEVLENLAKENAKRKLADVTRQQVADISSRARTLGEITAIVDKSFLNSNINPNTDYKDLYSTFAKTYNMVDEKGNPNFGGFNVENLFTKERAQRVMQNETMRLLPSAMQIINNSKGQIDSATLQKSLGISKNIADPLVNMAKDGYDREVKEWTFRNKTAILDRGLAAIRDGRNPTDEMEMFVSEMGYDLKNFPDSKKIIKSYADEAARIRKNENDDRNRKLEEQRRASVMQLENTFRTDPAIQAAIRSGDENRTTQLMLQRAKRYLTSEQFSIVYGVKPEAATPTLFAEVFRSEADEAVAGQKDAQGKRQDGAVSAATTAVQGVDKENLGRAQQAFGDGKGVTPLSGKAGGVGSMVAQDMSKKYVMTPQIIDAMSNVFANVEVEKGVPPSYASLMSAVENDPNFKQAAAGASLSAYKQDIYSRTKQNQGGFNVESFSGWYERTNNEISQAVGSLNKGLDKIKAMQDPNKRLASLQILQREMDRSFISASQEIEARRQRADRWVEYGTGGWNEGLVTGPSGTAINNILTRAREELQGQIFEVSALAEKERGGAGEGRPIEQNRSKSSADTPIGRAWEDTKSEVERGRALNTRALDYQVSGAFFGNFMSQSAEQRADAQAFNQFFDGVEGLRGFLMKNPAEYNSFMKDPIAYMKQFQGGKWYKNYQSSDK